VPCWPFCATTSRASEERSSDPAAKWATLHQLRVPDYRVVKTTKVIERDSMNGSVQPGTWAGVATVTLSMVAGCGVASSRTQVDASPRPTVAAPC